jgi:predicted Zn-ribbon and HTH transcriptional regulator
MPFLMLCPNKGCGANIEPYLDPSDNKVYCSSCDKEIPNVTHFVKTQMKSLKQFKPKKTVSFGVKCQKCFKEDRPKIINKDIACPHCKSIHSHLSEPFKIMLKDKLKTAGEEL